MKPVQISAQTKQDLQRNRRQLARERKRSREMAENGARTALQQAHYRVVREARAHNERAMHLGVMHLAKATMHSWGVDVPVLVTNKTSTKLPGGSTDYKSITVEWPTAMIPQERGDFNTDELASFAMVMKGVLYHELGHILWSTPWNSLMQPIEVKQAVMERLATLPEPGFIEFTDWASTFWKYWDSRPLQWACNVLEDSRMEMKMVSESPVLAAYFTQAVLMIVMGHNEQLARTRPDTAALGVFELTAGRTFLSKEIRRAARLEALKHFSEDDINEVAQIIRDYCGATTDIDLAWATWRLWLINTRLVGNVSPAKEHNNEGGLTRSKDDRDRRIEQSAQKDQEESDPQEGDSDQGQGEGEGEGDEGGDQIAGDQDDPSTTDSGGDASEAPRQRSFKELLNDELEAVQSQIRASDEVQDVVREIIGESMSAGIGCAPYQAAYPLDGATVAEAMQIAHELADTLRAAEANNAPMWMRSQERGVLEPFAYRTRQPGSREFHRDFVGNEDIGTDIRVTLVLDISGSMGWSEVQLSKIALACKSACAELSIRCDVLLYDYDVYALYADDDIRLPIRISAVGGTNPEPALEVVSQDDGEQRHVVMMMTDGMFQSSFRGFIPFMRQNQEWIGFGFGPYQAAADQYATALQRFGLPNSIGITTLEAIPLHLKSVLLAMR